MKIYPITPGYTFGIEVQETPFSDTATDMFGNKFKRNELGQWYQEAANEGV